MVILQILLTCTLIRTLYFDMYCSILLNKRLTEAQVGIRIREFNTTGYWREASLHPQGPATGQLD
jgi:hypothetical protein